MDLINITQQPIIEYSKLDEIAEEVKTELAKVDLQNLVIDEENLQFAKNLRAKYNKWFAEFEDARKLIKKAVNDPYDQFEKAYKDKIATLFKDTDATLKTAVDGIESGMKEEKRAELEMYFKEVAKDYDFIQFSQVGLNITLTATVKSLKEQIDKFVERVKSDIELIQTQEHHDRILVRYTQSLNVSQSITSVLNEVAQELAIAKRKEEALKETVSKEEAKPVENLFQTEVDPFEKMVTPTDNRFIVNLQVKVDVKTFEYLKKFMSDWNIGYEVK